MSHWYDLTVLDGLLEAISGSSTTLRLLDDYVVGQTHAEVVSNTVCSVDCIDTDYEVIADAGTNDRRLTVKTQTTTADRDSIGPENLHIAITDTAGPTVLVVTKETSDQPILNGNPVTFPAWYMQSSQPTQAT
jgi:hypothetical protein